ncbi:efflux transporter outer membrane subunit [Pseudomonas sp. RIT623]|uniref:efflux transporter outer membrane subunit n=1 Tax=Pseudomonas sp. RIT623 TaxID=2559075 RepID=UPI00107047CB|nr:efflux transporter outer membrane subunit [Pseudomonas sp. RIT623]TFF42565.1 efflux transporter outer membrane subunit [Pseudomonas sp. RIT623]
MKLKTLSLAVALALSGCSLIPDYQRPQADIPASWPQGAAYAAPAQAGDASALAWQSVFQDPALKRLVGQALANNTDLRQAALNLEAYRALHRIQRAEQFPNVELGASGSRQRVPADLSPTGEANIQSQYQVALGVSYELDLFGRLRSLSRAAAEQYLAADAARYSVQVSLVADVASAYLTWRGDQDQLALAQSTFKSQADSLALVEDRLDNGTASQIDVRQARTLVSQAQVQESLYTRQVAQDLNALERLLGGRLPTDLPQGQPLGESMLAVFPTGLNSEVLLRRPDIRAAEHHLLAANANIGAARAAFFPSISLSGAAGTASAELDGLFKGGAGMWQFVPQINLPIFNAGRLKADLDYARIRRDINVAEYEGAIQTAFQEVSDGLAARGTYGKQLHSQQGRVEDNQAYYELARQRYDEGVDSYMAVLDAQRELFAAQQQLIQDRLAQLLAEVNLFKAVGGGWHSETVAAVQGSLGHPAP